MIFPSKILYNLGFLILSYENYVDLILYLDARLYIRHLDFGSAFRVDNWHSAQMPSATGGR